MNVVITGSTKGIGLGLARDFLKRNHNVMISSRGEDAVKAALATLAGCGAGKAAGCAADISNPADARQLWDRAIATFGSVDIWINNAGVTNRKAPFVELADEQIATVIATNINGVMNGCKVAITGMLAQGHGTIFNMEGFGSDGLTGPGMSVYGTTKCAVRYFTKALIKDCKDTPLVIGLMSPGVVVTDLLVRDLYQVGSSEFEKRRRFMNIFADHVETVTPFLVEGALAARKTGVAVRWMSPAQALPRLVKSLFVKRDLFGDGNATRA
ncbi:MAG: SDR family oxidoreductase [Chromatiales bacterium]|nr:MAG: SDR family oxidoreductase [Chromatiales bacterium]